MKKTLKKKKKPCSKAVIYFSDELIYYWKPMIFDNSVPGRCKWSCS